MTRRLGLIGSTLALLLALVVPPAIGQVLDTQQITAVSSGGLCSTGACATFQMQGSATFTLQVSGTFTGTLTFEATSDGTNWGSVLMSTLSSGATTTSATAAGQFSAGNAGLLLVRARATAWTSGTAVVTATRGWAIARGGTGGGIANPYTVTGAISGANGALLLGEAVSGVLSFYNTGSGVTNIGQVNSAVTIGNNGAGSHVYIGNNSMIWRRDTPIGWGTSTTDPAGSPVLDTAIGRNAAGVVETNNGTLGTITDLKTRHVFGGGTAPTVADTSANSCGSGAETIAGNDLAGLVTVIGSAGTSCRVTFGTAYAAAPVCLAANQTTAASVRAEPATTTVTLTGTFLQNDVIAYVCVGR